MLQSFGGKIRITFAEDRKKMKKYEKYEGNLSQEAVAFDSQIIQRVNGGHIPDLDNMRNCDYFYNNPWRRKYFAELDFGEQRDLIVKTLQENLNQNPGELKILEVGSGPGYMSLALARKGYNVTGLELSSECIEIACSTAKEFSPEVLKTNLNYICDDFFQFSKQHVNEFDAVLFVGAMHHFPDQGELNASCKKILKKNGLIICHEPVRDCISRKNAIANLLVTTLLSIGRSYYRVAEEGYENNIPRDIHRIFKELRYELEDGNKAQSINDNEAGYKEMHPLLKQNFKEIDFQWRYGFFHEVIGGIRLVSEENEAKLARFIREMDRIMCEENMIDPSEFFFVGKNL